MLEIRWVLAKVVADYLTAVVPGGWLSVTAVPSPVDPPTQFFWAVMHGSAIDYTTVATGYENGLELAKWQAVSAYRSQPWAER